MLNIMKLERQELKAKIDRLERKVILKDKHTSWPLVASHYRQLADLYRLWAQKSNGAQF